MDEQHPLRGSDADESGRWKRLEPGKKYRLLVGVLDPSQQTTSAPMADVKVEGDNLYTYNQILARTERIWDYYYGAQGYVFRPDTFTNEAQAAVMEEMSDAGALVQDLLAGVSRPLRSWIDGLWGTADEGSARDMRAPRPDRHITIITNDFAIPWYWLKKQRYGPFLCEVCSLGILQLEAAGGSISGYEESGDGSVEPGHERQALMINGSCNLPFAGDELKAVKATLEKQARQGEARFICREVEKFDQIPALYREHQNDRDMISLFRIVHFSGHYSDQDLFIADDRIPEHFLGPFVNGSMLVLDGCSSAKGLKAWTDVNTLTSRLINRGGALGCVVTVLPVKHDPIVGEEFWRTFYANLRRDGTSVGHALVRARNDLRDRLRKCGSHDPTWALYQLIGSPAVTLVAEKEGGI